MNRYTYTDNLFLNNTKSQHLRLESNSAILNVFRIISGTANIRDSYKSKNYKLRSNYIKLPLSINSRLSSNTILENFPQEVKIDDLNQYFLKAKKNIKFYKFLEIELLKCIIANENKNYLESFFYLYRIIEGISYSIPLIWISKKTDYNKTYHDLQSFFGKDKDGELNFFKRFIGETFKNEDFYNSTIDILFSELDEDLREKYFNIILKKLKERYIISKNENVSISVQFIGFYDLLIELRNRFFHSAKGSWQENLDSTELLYPDLFFKLLVDHGINWISIIIFEIIKADFAKIPVD